MIEKYGKYKVLPKYGDYNNGLEKLLTSGAGDIYLAENVEEEKGKKRMYVIKVLKKEKKPNIWEEKAFNEEIKTLQLLSNLPGNKYFPKLYDSQEYQKSDKNEINIKNGEKIKAYYVIDYITNSCLYYYTSPYNLKEERTTKLLFKKIVEAVQFLHENNICHLDLKPENILLDKNFEPIIIDFGSIEKFIGTNKEVYISEGKLVSQLYKAPEVQKQNIIDGEKADVFSLGAILFNIVTGGYIHGNPYDKYNKIKLNLSLSNKRYENYWEVMKKNNYYLNLSKEFKDLYLSMVDSNPKERLTIEEVLKSDWLKEVSNLEEGEEKKEEREELEKEYKNFFSELLDEIWEGCHELEKSKEIIDQGYITRAIEGGEFILFDLKNENLKPKKILDDSRHINLYIKINRNISEIDFMNSLIICISNYLNGLIKLSEDSLKFEVFFENKEEMDGCTIEIELFEYEKGRYLLEFMRTEGEIEDYYHYFFGIKDLIQKMI